MSVAQNIGSGNILEAGGVEISGCLTKRWGTENAFF